MRTEALVGPGALGLRKSQPQGQGRLGTWPLLGGGTGPEESARARGQPELVRSQSRGWVEAEPKCRFPQSPCCSPASASQALPVEHARVYTHVETFSNWLFFSPCKPLRSLEASPHTSTGCGEPRPEWALQAGLSPAHLAKVVLLLSSPGLPGVLRSLGTLTI